MQGVLEEARYFNMTALVARLEGESGVCEAEITRSQVLSALLHSPSGTPIRFRGLNLARLQLSRLDLSNVMLEFSNMDGAKLDYADLSHASLTKATLVGADLKMACMRKAVIVQSNLCGANLQGVDMFGVNGEEAIMTGVQLQKEALSAHPDPTLNFSSQDLTLTQSTRQANLLQANLENAVLDSAVLDGAELAQCHLKCVFNSLVFAPPLLSIRLIDAFALLAGVRTSPTRHCEAPTSKPPTSTWRSWKGRVWKAPSSTKLSLVVSSSRAGT